MSKWMEIYNNRKDLYDFNDLSIENLLNISGYNHINSIINIDDLDNWLNLFELSVKFDFNDSAYQVCCGASAILTKLYPFRGGGLDFSIDMINLSKKINPIYNYECNPANKLNTLDKYDHVFSFTGFNYFESFDYALDVLDKMINKATKTISLLDILDIKKKKDDIIFKKTNYENYDNESATVNHLYFDKKLIEEYLDKRNDIEKYFYIDGINNYINSNFRFNLIIIKK